MFLSAPRKTRGLRFTTRYRSLLCRHKKTHGVRVDELITMLEFLQQFTDVRRIFQYDYIYIDAVFLLVWIVFLIRNKKYSALIFGAIIAPIIAVRPVRKL